MEVQGLPLTALRQQKIVVVGAGSAGMGVVTMIAKGATSLTLGNTQLIIRELVMVREPDNCRYIVQFHTRFLLELVPACPYSARRIE
jgi:cation diffusion facilitator CzcD-associated flavoprotein CzcO